MIYLYRNQVIKAMDDVRAEFEYMLEHLNDNVDGGELTKKRRFHRTCSRNVSCPNKMNREIGVE